MNNLVTVEPIALPLLYCLMDLSFDGLYQSSKGLILAYAIIQVLKIKRYDGEDCVQYFWRKVEEWKENLYIFLKAM
jgi:hypothetical protein